MLRKVTRSGGGDIGPGWELVVMHHTDGGVTRLAGSPDLPREFFGVEEPGLHAKAVDDPYAAVVVDVMALRDDHRVHDAVVVSGLVYDVETGLVEAVVEPA